MKIQLTADKSAIALSALCLVHCLILPAAAILMPTLLALPFEDKLFHRVLLVGVIPISAFALLSGCQKHRTWSLLAWGISGLVILVFAGLFGHDLLGETGERIATVIGSACLTICHYKNYRLCRSHACRQC